MTDSSPVFVDTNVLIYARLAKSPLHAAAVHAVHRLQEEGCVLWISRQVLREYLAAMTRPDTLAEPVPIASLVADVRAFAAQFQVVEDGPHVTERLLNLVTSITTPILWPRCKHTACHASLPTIRRISHAMRG